MLLLGSMLLSIALWWYIYSLKFAIMLIFSLFIHEYGHYFWMGKEGITKKRMFFMPPFGAVAQSLEMFPGLGAEARIALAGPAFGLIPTVLFYLLWLLTGNLLFLASIYFSSFINLFNLLLPIPILDGGRVIKSSLISINPKLGSFFYMFGFITLAFCLTSGYLSPMFVLLIGYFLWQESQSLAIIIQMKPMVPKDISLNLCIFGLIILVYLVFLFYSYSYLASLHRTSGIYQYFR